MSQEPRPAPRAADHSLEAEPPSLDRVRAGQQVRVATVAGHGLRHRRLVDLGLVPGTVVDVLPRAAAGDPGTYRFRGVTVALYLEEARLVRVVSADEEEPFNELDATPVVRAPGRYPVARGQRADRDGSGAERTAVLIGNPGTGKAALFDRLVGLRRRERLVVAGDPWPEGRFSRPRPRRAVRLLDLPETYSLLSDAPGERAARSHLLFGQPDAVAVVVDASALERSLALVFQAMEITPRVVVGLTGLRRVRRQGGALEPAALADELGLPVISVSPDTGEGVVQLQDALTLVAWGELTPAPRLTYLPEPMAGAVDRLARQLLASYPALEAHRWVALRLLEEDPDCVQALADGRLTALGRPSEALRYRLAGPGQGGADG